MANSVDPDQTAPSGFALFAYVIFVKMRSLNFQKLKFSDKNSHSFHISAQNIDCVYSSEPPHRGGSKKYPQSMFLSRNKNNNVYPYKPQVLLYKSGLRGSILYRYVFLRMKSGAG